MAASSGAAWYAVAPGRLVELVAHEGEEVRVQLRHVAGHTCVGERRVDVARNVGDREFGFIHRIAPDQPGPVMGLGAAVFEFQRMEQAIGNFPAVVPLFDPKCGRARLG